MSTVHTCGSLCLLFLSVFASACEGECQFAPERCAPRNVTLHPATMDTMAGGNLSISFPEDTRHEGQMIVDLVPNQGYVDPSAKVIPLTTLSPPTNSFSLAIKPMEISRGSFYLRIRQNGTELTFQSERPLFHVMQTTLMWKQSPMPVQFPQPADVKLDANHVPVKMNLRSVSVGRATTSNKQAEIVMRYSYMNTTDYLVTAVDSLNGPKPSALDFSATDNVESWIDLWRFPSSALQGVKAVRTAGGGYQLTGVALQSPEQTMDFSRLNSVTFTRMALAVDQGQQALLTAGSGGIMGYHLSSAAIPVAAPVQGWPASNPSISSIIGYADTVSSTDATAPGFILFDNNGVPYAVSLHDNMLSLDPARTMALQHLNLGGQPISAVAAGDINGDTMTDLAIASGRTVTFFLHQLDGSFFAAGTQTLPDALLQPAALAIGQVDGQGLPDLLIGDGNPEKCAGTTGYCNTVYVFLNQSITN